jgi:hypothetical protein
VVRAQAAHRRAAQVAVLVLAVLLLRASPAAAHTELTASTPSPGAVVASTTAEVVLTFSGRVQGDFSTVAVTGPDGADRARGPLAVRGGRVVQGLDAPLAAGAWTVAYRVIAADGHPVTGTVPFTVAAAAQAPSTPPAPSTPSAPSTVPSSPSASPAAVPSSTAAPAPDVTPASDESPFPQALAPAAAVLAVAAAGAALLVRRSRRR